MPRPRIALAAAAAAAVLLGSGGVAQAAPKPKPELSYGDCIAQANKAADPRAARALCVRPNSKPPMAPSALGITTDLFDTFVSGTGLQPGTTVGYVFTTPSGEVVSGTFDDHLGAGDHLAAPDGTFTYRFATQCESVDGSDGVVTPIYRDVVVTGTAASGQPVTGRYAYQPSDCPPLA